MGTCFPTVCPLEDQDLGATPETLAVFLVCWVREGMRGDPRPLSGLRVTEDGKIFLGLRKLQLSSISHVPLSHHKRIFLECFASQSGRHNGSVNLSKGCIKTAIIYFFAVTQA